MNDGTRNALALAAIGLGATLGARALLDPGRRYSFAGKTVLLTGGSRGLGLVLARQLAREGAKLALVARDAAELERAEAELESQTEVLTLPFDVTHREQVEMAVAVAEGKFGAIDVLINNAGLISVGPLESQTLGDFEEAMAIHFWAPLYMVLAVLPGMRERGEGRIVNIASIGGKVSVPHLLPYCASKFALVGLSEGLRAELAQHQIRVTTVCPGLMRTGSPRNALFKGQQDAEYSWFTVADSLPGLAIQAERAARQILAACRRGQAELIITLPAAAASAFHGLFPGLTSDVLGMVNQVLPRADHGGTEAVPGRLVETAVTRSPITVLTREAAAANNQL